MSNMYIFKVPYTCKCEKCEKEISGMIERGPLQIGSGVLSTGLQTGMYNSEMKFSKKLIESDLENGTTKYFKVSPEKCPSCGTRQTWYPMAKPKKPSYIGLYIAGLVFFPLIFAGIWAIFFFDKLIPFIILMTIGIFLGFFLPYRSQKKNKAKEMETYKKLLDEYEKYKESEKNAIIRHKPDINWDLARQVPIE